jgi:hypothetical protein
VACMACCFVPGTCMHLSKSCYNALSCAIMRYHALSCAIMRYHALQLSKSWHGMRWHQRTSRRDLGALTTDAMV